MLHLGFGFMATNEPSGSGKAITAPHLTQREYKQSDKTQNAHSERSSHTLTATLITLLTWRKLQRLRHSATSILSKRHFPKKPAPTSQDASQKSLMIATDSRKNELAAINSEGQ